MLWLRKTAMVRPLRSKPSLHLPSTFLVQVPISGLHLRPQVLAALPLSALEAEERGDDSYPCC